jgi:hypothetical protein
MSSQVTECMCDGCGEVVRVTTPNAIYRTNRRNLKVGSSIGWCRTCDSLRAIESYPRDPETYDMIIGDYSEDDQHPVWDTLEEWVLGREILSGKAAAFRCLNCSTPQEVLVGPAHVCGGTFHICGLDIDDDDGRILELDPPAT